MSREPGRGPWPGEGEGDGVIKDGEAGRAARTGLRYGLAVFESDGDPSHLPEDEVPLRLRASTSSAKSERTASIVPTRGGPPANFNPLTRRSWDHSPVAWAGTAQSL